MSNDNINNNNYENSLIREVENDLKEYKLINDFNEEFGINLTLKEHNTIKRFQQRFRNKSQQRLQRQREHATDGQFSQISKKKIGSSMGYTLGNKYGNPVAFEKKPLYYKESNSEEFIPRKLILGKLISGEFIPRKLIPGELIAISTIEAFNEILQRTYQDNLKISFHAGSFNKNSLNYISKKVGERGDFFHEIKNKMNLLNSYKDQKNYEIRKNIEIQKMQNTIWSFLLLDNQRKNNSRDNYDEIVFIKNKIKGLLDSMTQNQSDFMKNNVDFMKNNADLMKDYVKIFQEWHEFYENLEQIYHLMPFVKDIDMSNLVAIRDKNGKISEFKIIDFSVDVNFDFNGKTPNQDQKTILESLMKNLIKNTTQHTLKQTNTMKYDTLNNLNFFTTFPKDILNKAHMDVFKELKQKYPDLENDEDCTFDKFKKFMSERKILKNKKTKSREYKSFNNAEIFTSEQMKLFLNQLQEKYATAEYKKNIIQNNIKLVNSKSKVLKSYLSILEGKTFSDETSLIRAWKNLCNTCKELKNITLPPVQIVTRTGVDPFKKNVYKIDIKKTIETIQKNQISTIKLSKNTEDIVDKVNVLKEIANKKFPSRAALQKEIIKKININNDCLNKIPIQRLQNGCFSCGKKEYKIDDTQLIDFVNTNNTKITITIPINNTGVLNNEMGLSLRNQV